MQPPIEPKREDCCNSGCNPCIFDVYENQLQLYKSYIENGRTTNFTTDNAMSQLDYKPFNVIDNSDICREHKLLLFKQNIMETDKLVFWYPGEYLLVKYQSGKDAFTRAYTPIKLEHNNGDYDFAIIVRRYKNGLVSSYLCNLQVGDCSLWRGPYGHYRLDSKFCRLVMIAQGTGIAPFYSIIKHVLDNKDNMTRIALLYCCKCLDTILFRDELYSFNSYWNFDYTVYLSNISNDVNLKYKEPIVFARLTASDVLDLNPFTDRDQFLLCGSKDFMSQYSDILKENKSLDLNIVKF